MLRAPVVLEVDQALVAVLWFSDSGALSLYLLRLVFCCFARKINTYFESRMQSWPMSPTYAPSGRTLQTSHCQSLMVWERGCVRTLQLVRQPPPRLSFVLGGVNFQAH